jgi:hypothetical protein
MIMIILTTALLLRNLPAISSFLRGGHVAAPLLLMFRAYGRPAWADLNPWGDINLGQLEIFRLCGSAHGQQRSSCNNKRGSRHGERYLGHLRLSFLPELIF